MAAAPGDGAAQLFRYAVALHQKGQLSQARALYERILADRPRNFGALHLLGVLACQTGNPALGEELIGKAIAINPGIAAAHSNLGNALKDLNRLDEALASYDKAIAIEPNYADAFSNRGVALMGLRRLDEALASCERAIDIKPDYAEAHYNRAVALIHLRRPVEALASCDQAIAIKPDYAKAFYVRGKALTDLKRPEETYASLKRALAIKPDYPFLVGLTMHLQLKLCDWSDDVAGQLARLESAILEGRKATSPFPLLGLSDNPRLQMQASRLYVEAKHPDQPLPGGFAVGPRSDRIRIGYYSADFHNHATSYLMAELFESHDRQRFEVYGFSFGPGKPDEMRGRVSAGFDRFFEVGLKSDLEIARLSRETGIDIAVDLKGFTQDNRMGIFARRCAPTQVNYLGYPGTLAASYFDYIVADRTVIPEEERQHYLEKVVWLPHSYQVNDSKRRISDRVFTRKDAGLPESGFVFCCFNNNYKILPQTFEGWMRLLRAVEGSVLWLFEDNPTAAGNLRREAQARGVDPGRLVFAERMELSEHLARHRLADLFLDTLPYNAHTTASDALWAGLPVLTRMGRSFPARVAASLLNALGLPELVTGTEEEYEARAVELATVPGRLEQVKARLERNRSISPLFDGRAFARHLEAAYLAMQERRLSGQAPDHIHVAP